MAVQLLTSNEYICGMDNISLGNVHKMSFKNLLFYLGKIQKIVLIIFVFKS